MTFFSALNIPVYSLMGLHSVCCVCFLFFCSRCFVLKESKQVSMEHLSLPPYHLLYYLLLPQEASHNPQHPFLPDGAVPRSPFISGIQNFSLNTCLVPSLLLNSKCLVGRDPKTLAAVPTLPPPNHAQNLFKMILFLF